MTPNGQPPGQDPNSVNVLLLSEKLKELIAEAVTAGIHPASVMGVLAYHQSAMASHFQSAFVSAQPVRGIVAPPPGFKLPPTPPPGGGN